jgi:serine/threonine-protein kinase
MGSNTEKPDSPESRVTEAGPSIPSTPGPGFRLNGRYAIERELGRGGIGVVYLARDERLHQMPVVIKFLLDASERNAWLAKKFLQEAEALTRINHPAVVRVIDRDTAEDGRPFFVMEFIGGEPLRAVMKDGGINLEQAAQILRQIGQGLAAAHAQGVIHRDLKPENILLQRLTTGEEQVKLIDFGIAKIADSQSGAATEVAMVAGSLQYISPEQLNAQPVSAATDIYALGIIAYELVTGRRPFNPDAPGYAAMVQKLTRLQENEQFPALRHWRRDLPGAAEVLISSALRFDPLKRPQNARIFGDELARALTGAVSVNSTAPTEISRTAVQTPSGPLRSPKVSAPLTAPTLTPADPPRRSFIPIIAIVAIIIALAIVGIIWLTSSGEKTQNPSTIPPPQQNSATPLELDYSVTLQKDPKRYPGSKPFDLPGEVIFSPGDRIRLNIMSPQTGYLYIINEGPEVRGTPSYNTLFPSETSNQGSAQVTAGRAIHIPERGDGFVFDAQEGTEKLWLIWAPRELPIFEAVKHWANPRDGGTIKDPAQVEAIRQFLANQMQTTNQVEKNDASKRTIIRVTGEALIHLVKLEHH